MTTIEDSRLRSLADDELLRRLDELSRLSRGVEAELVAHIDEVDARRLYLRQACSSMFSYCTERLHLSEAEAYLRITAARAAREHPALLQMLADGRLHLSAIARLAPYLTVENRELVLRQAVHQSKRDILELVARLSPQAVAPPMIRRLPEPRNQFSSPYRAPKTRVPSVGSDADAAPEPDARAARLCPGGVGSTEPPMHSRRPPHADRIEPTSPGRYRVQFTASDELRGKLERLRSLMRFSVPDGDLATVIEEAVTEKLARLEARRFARVERPRTSLSESARRPSSRQIPAAVRRAVAERDGSQCAYRDAQGRRCSASERLEYHHRRPYGYGGDHSVENIALLCHAHNRLIAETDYGLQGRSSDDPGHRRRGRTCWRLL